MEEYENFDAMHEAARRLVEGWEREEDGDPRVPNPVREERENGDDSEEGRAGRGAVPGSPGEDAS